MKKVIKVIEFLFAGINISAVLLIISVVFAGAGHGTAFFGLIFFPLSAIFFYINNSFGFIYGIVTAVLYYPVYSLVLMILLEKNKSIFYIMIFFIVFHTISIIFAFVIAVLFL